MGDSRPSTPISQLKAAGKVKQLRGKVPSPGPLSKFAATKKKRKTADTFTCGERGNECLESCGGLANTSALTSLTKSRQIAFPLCMVYSLGSPRGLALNANVLVIDNEDNSTK